MILPSLDQRREAGFTLWIIGWLSSIPCLAAPRADGAWPAAAFLSLSLVAAGLYLVRDAARGPRAAGLRDAPP